MNYTLAPLSQIDDAGIEQLAVLHRSVMHTLLSDLGLPMVLRYYQVAKKDPSVIGCCTVDPSGEIFGWAVGSPDPDKVNARLRRPMAWFSFQMLHLAFTHPLVLWQLISSVLSTSSQSEIKSGAIELTYIGVALHKRDKGIGRALLHAFMDASRSKGYRSVLLSVETLNSPAIALYEKAGFRIIKTYSEGRYQRHRMESSLV